ncbi:hypothetical protein ACFYOV_16430 [Streptomyces sp. NPDC005931]
MTHLGQVLEGRAGPARPTAEPDAPEQRVVSVRGQVDAAGLPGFLESGTD